MLLTKLAVLHTFLEEFWVFSIKEEGQSGNKLFLLSVNYIHFEFALLFVITEDFDRLPGILFLAEARRNSMGFIWPLRTVV